MAIPLDPNQVASTEKLLVFEVGRRKALTRLVVERRTLTNQEDER